MARKESEIKTVEHILTNENRLEYSKELSEMHSKKRRLEDSLKSYSTQMKAEISSCDAKMNVLAEKLNTGREYREVDCSIYYNFDSNEKSWYRKDNGEFVNTAKITQDEWQEELDLRKVREMSDTVADSQKPKDGKQIAFPKGDQSDSAEIEKMNQKAQQEVDEFNARFAVGQEVDVTLDNKSIKRTKIAAPASVVSCTAVAWLEGIRGCYVAERVRAVETEA